MKTRNMILNLSAFFLLLMPVFSMAQSDWMVSADKQAQKSPIAFSSESAKSGKQIYMANCKSCHGDLTKDNGLPLVPKPTDLGLQAFLDKNSDGSIFNKMTDGHGSMPTFGSILSADQRWNIVNYVRSFDANHKSAAAPVQNNTEQAKTTDIGKPYSLDVKIDKATTEAIVTFYGTSNGKKVPVEGAEIFVGIKRYFGNLPITDMGVVTDKNGQIKTSYPCDMPSGESGEAVLLAYPIDKDLYGDISAKADLLINTCHPSEFNETRALWANRAHFPIWLIITYLSMVIIAWGVMVKAILNVIKIKKLGN